MSHTIITALLVKSFEELTEKIAHVSGLSEWIQIDVVDGVYAPQPTWPYVNDDAGMFNRIVKQELTLPHVDDYSLEVDLMVSDPLYDADKWIAVGATRLIVHINTLSQEKLMTLVGNMKEKGIRLVLGFGINESIDTLKKCIDAIGSTYGEEYTVDAVQCMGIDNEGFQGQAFDEKVLKNISDIHAMYPSLDIAVDGGVDLITAPRLLKAGATRLVIGSALLSAVDIDTTYEQFARLTV